jgi:hypothetical protein
VPAEARDMDLLVDVTTPISWSCCVAVLASTFDDMGGFDERFRGWGFEDGAWAALVRAMYPWARIDGDMYHLDHPRSDERIILGESRSTASSDYVRNALLGRRYMVAAIRDHAAGDQTGEEHLSPDLVKVHVANLTNDDKKFLAMAKERGMPEAAWATWWPTLEQLRDGAKAYRGRAGELDHPGGHDRRRRGDLGGAVGLPRASLASLNERVTGPIVQRVVYSDWAGHRDELAAIANEAGFYVVGDGHHGYTGARRRLWTYLAKRARGQYVFATEDDFVYDRDVDLAAMIETLDEQPDVRQLALLRGPYYPRELEAGGVLESLSTPVELQNHRPTRSSRTATTSRPTPRSSGDR